MLSIRNLDPSTIALAPTLPDTHAQRTAEGDSQIVPAKRGVDMTTGAKILWAIIMLGCAMVLVSVATSAELTLAWDGLAEVVEEGIAP